MRKKANRKLFKKRLLSVLTAFCLLMSLTAQPLTTRAEEMKAGQETDFAETEVTSDAGSDTDAAETVSGDAVPDTGEDTEQSTAESDTSDMDEEETAVDVLTTYSGTCGDNLTWKLSTSTGKLTISGSGKMSDYVSLYYTPWYSYRSYIKTLSIGSSVTHIGNNAFYICQNLTSVSLPESVKSIGKYAFFGCDAMTSLTISGSSVSIGAHAFSNCDSLSSVSVPDDLTDIGSAAFYECPNLADSDGFVIINHILCDYVGSDSYVTVPDTVTQLCGCAFYYTPDMIQVSIPDSVTSIGDSAFQACYALESIEIPNSVLELGDEAFYHCYALSEVSLPDGLTSLGERIFWGCSSLKNILIPNNVESIGVSAFRGCSSLQNVTLGNGLSEISSYVFYDCVSLETVFYVGTSIEWSAVSVESSGNDAFFDAEFQCMDIWGFSNSGTYFGSSGYYITSDDLERLASNLDNTELANLGIVDTTYAPLLRSSGLLSPLFNIDGEESLLYYTTWNGSCYGMSAWVALAAADVLSAADIDADTASLYDFEDCDEAEQSAINYYFYQQSLSPAVYAVAEFMSLAQVSQVELLEREAEEAQENGTAVFIRFQWYQVNGSSMVTDSRGDFSHAGHVIVGYGVQDGDYTDYVSSYTGSVGSYTVDMSSRVLSGTEFTHKILIYDPSAPEGGDAFDLYYSDDGTWCIPGWGVISQSSQSRDTIYNNGQLKLVTDSAQEINLVDYNTGVYTNTYSDSDELLDILTSYVIDYSVTTEDYSADISGYTVSDSTADEEIYVSVEENITADGESTASSSSALLPAAECYTVTTADEVKFTLDTGAYFSNVVSTGAGSVTFGTDGAVSIETQEAETTYISVTADEGETDLSWDTIEVAAEDTASVSVELTDEGIVISGDDLSAVYVSGTSDGDGDADETDQMAVKISSESDSVLVCEGEDGEAQVLSDADGDGTYESTEENVDSLITTLTAENVTLSASSVTYNGSAQTPQVTVTAAAGLDREVVTLTEGTDYEISWSGTCKNAGTYTVTVTGLGLYTGTVEKTFTVKRKSISKFTGTLSTTSYTYTGKAKTPSVTVKGTVGSSKKTLKKNTDYTVTYASGRINCGKYKVTIKGTGNYTGTITKYFKIKPKKAYSPTLKSSSKKKLKVSWKKSPGKVSGYQIYYRVKGTSTWKKAYTTSTSKTLKSLKSGKTYQVKVRAYKTIDGKKYYGSFSSVKTKKVK